MVDALANADVPVHDNSEEAALQHTCCFKLLPFQISDGGPPSEGLYGGAAVDLLWYSVCVEIPLHTIPSCAVPMLLHAHNEVTVTCLVNLALATVRLRTTPC